MVPSISTPVTPRILPLGAAVAIQLTASNEPTAWLASLPAGLEIDSAGLITGIPTTAGISSSSITAANDDGTSAAVTIQFVVADNVPGLSEGFDQNYWLWNIAIGKKLFKNERGELALAVNDVLKQNRSISRNVTETYIEDTWTNALQRFVMLSFTYNIRNFGKAPETKPSGDRPWEGRPPGF